MNVGPTNSCSHVQTSAKQLDSSQEMDIGPDVDAAVQLIVLRGLLASRDKTCLDKIASSMGYTSEGISKHSPAAKCQSLEARLYDGGVPKKWNGGVTASMQSIGTTGRTKTVIGAELLERLALAGVSKKRLRRFERALKWCMDD